MADNVSITAGSGTVISTEEITTLNGGAVSAQQVQRIAAALRTADGTAIDLPGDTTNGLDVDVTRLPALAAGTNNIGDVDVLTLPGVAGTVAHDAVDSGNPVKMGLKAISYATQTAVAAGDRHDAVCDRHGSQFVIGGHPDVVTLRTQFTAAQTNVALVTVAAGTRIVVTQLQVTLDNASTVFPLVRIGFGAVSTPTTTGVLAAHGGVPAGGGFSRGDGSGILGVGADDEDLRITTVGTATGNGVEVVITYYTIPG